MCFLKCKWNWIAWNSNIQCQCFFVIYKFPVTCLYQNQLEKLLFPFLESVLQSIIIVSLFDSLVCWESQREMKLNGFKWRFYMFLCFSHLYSFIITNLKKKITTNKILMYSLLDIAIMVRVFANGPGNRGSIPGRVIPKTKKMVLDALLLNTQHYKVEIKGNVEQSKERSSAHLYTSV